MIRRPQPSLKAPAERRAAATLLEVLLAIAIFVIIAGLFGTIYFSVMRTMRLQKDWLDVGKPVLQALAVIERDLNHCFSPTNLQTQAFALSREDLGGSNSILVLCTLFQNPGESNSVPERVVYSLKRDVKSPFPVLVREVQSFAGNSGVLSDPVPEVLGSRIAGFYVEALKDKTMWLPEWDSKEAGLPRAARVQLRFEENGRPRQLEIHALIPAGNSTPAIL